MTEERRNKVVGLLLQRNALIRQMPHQTIFQAVNARADQLRVHAVVQRNPRRGRASNPGHLPVQRGRFAGSRVVSASAQRASTCGLE